MIVIVDYGLGNLRSIFNKFERIGIKAIISDQVEDIFRADKLILPGVGHFASAMNNLSDLGLTPIISRKVIQEKIPILGICLGMQLFSQRSEEGSSRGFGWIDAVTVRFNPTQIPAHLKIPHMGWNSIRKHNESALLNGIEETDMLYFGHSYHVNCRNQADVIATSEYGYEFACAIQHHHIYGTQFHPEKSHKAGLRILKNFAAA